MNSDETLAARMVRAAFPGRSVAQIVSFAEGASNDTWKVTLDAPAGVIVLRVYRSTASLHAEVAALSAVSRRVPVPALLHADPGTDDMPAFVALEYIDGITFRQFRRAAGDQAAISAVARQIGRILAGIHACAVDPAGEQYKHPDPQELPAMIDRLCRSDMLHRRLGAQFLGRAQSLVAQERRELNELSEHARFVHGDFNNRNVLVRCTKGEWRVAAVVDWECAGHGTPLYDVARFLQYESPASPSREPGFSCGYREAGGRLPDRWWWLARTINLVHQCQLLADPELPEEIVPEVVNLVRTTIAESETPTRGARR